MANLFSLGFFNRDVWREMVWYYLRVHEKITLQSIVLRFGSGLVDLIELNRKRSLSCVEDSANEDQTKMA